MRNLLLNIFFVRETNLTNVPVLFVESFFYIDSGKINSFNKDGMVHFMFKGSQVDFRIKYVLQSLKIAFIIANSADPDKKQITKLQF